MSSSSDTNYDLPQYYLALNDESINAAFKSLDDHGNFRELDGKARHPHSKNFILDFGDDAGFCGFDLDEAAVTTLLNAARPAELNTRWINIWAPHEQRDLITEIARHFEFSPRLLGFMLSPPLKGGNKSQATKRSMFNRIRRRRPIPNGKPTLNSSIRAVEDGDAISDSNRFVATEPDLINSMNQYSLANEVWHWSSVDWGRHFICLGYNSLYQVNCHQRSRRELAVSDAESGDDDNPRVDELPGGKRIWSWLILTQDKTVITISEDPFPFSGGDLDASEHNSLLVIRRNMINVFRNCSKAYDFSGTSPAMKLPIRLRVGDSDEETVHRASDVPGLLFYFLFDDWFGSYSLVFRREHRYAFELDQLRKAMMDRASLDHVNRLHSIGRQLGVLKRMYEGYQLIIDQVLAKQEASLASLKNSHVMSGVDNGAQSLDNSVPQVTESQSLLGVGLSSAARVRFERLRHRIQLYALSEIEDCLVQKENLVMMNFNLIAIKESLSVERLTRITLLVAKVTILFMPVSLMSAYFSSQFVDTTFTSREYWNCFGIILAVSLLAILSFSVISGTLEGRMIYKPFGQRLVDWFGGKAKRRRKNLRPDGM